MVSNNAERNTGAHQPTWNRVLQQSNQRPFDGGYCTYGDVISLGSSGSSEQEWGVGEHKYK